MSTEDRIDRELTEASARLKASLSDEPVPPPRSQAFRPRYVSLGAAVAVFVGLIGLAYIGFGPTNEPPETADPAPVSPPSIRTRTLIDTDSGFSVTYPVGWTRTKNPLAPVGQNANAGRPQVIAIGSAELVEGSSPACRTIPEYAIEALGNDDVLITIGGSPTPGADWPSSFGPASFPANAELTDFVRTCTDRFDVLVWEGDFTLDGRDGTILVVATTATPDSTLDAAWDVLDSFEVIEVPDPTELLHPEWSIAYPGDWYRADSELMPGIEWASTTLATFPLEPGTCAYYPGGSLQAMSSTDSLITLLFTNEQFGGAWPADGFDDTVFRPESGSEAATICDGLDDLEIHWDVWQNNGRGLRILVAFGAEVTDAQRDETWAIVSSLKRVPGSGGTCVVTAPMEPDWVPPGLWPNYPSDELQAWFGSPDLWTALPKSPWYYVPRLSAWWSQHYTDPGRDPQPDIFVTYDRIGTAETVTSSDLGTNASTPQDGVFMIADIAVEFPSSGCWRVWAEYEGFTVSYVIQVP